ncbi:MAG TPA: response regulator [Chloroflexi bacterium]|nr:response regulator [Chloroflexota bacterium]
MDGRILIVDDSTSVVEALSRILTGRGYQVESCSDGESGWDRLLAGVENRTLPDLLMLDINMPGIDGLTLLRRLRDDERFALLPVVILTVEADADTRLRALELGANDYLAKPVQTLELLARVKTLLDWKLAERRQQQRMQHLIQAGNVLLSTLDLNTVLQRVMRIAMVGMQAEGTSIWLRNVDERLECRAASGGGQERLIGIYLTPGQGIAGWVFEHKQSVLVGNAQIDPRFYREVDAQIDFRTRDLIAVPLVVRGISIGVLEATNKKEEVFSPADLAWMEVLAPMAAVAIANARLFQSLRQRTSQLQTRNEELRAFAATVAHDLKTPLSSIVGFAEALETSCMDMPEDELCHYLNTIGRSGRRMNRIIDALLLLAGIGITEVTIGPLDMANIVDEVMQRLSMMIKQQEAEIILPASWPTAMGYGPWIEEVWSNYVSNAIKYGGDPPRVKLDSTMQRDGMIRFWVRDNGPGLSPDSQSKLFVPFTRLDRNRAEGHGLGLAIVQRIVEKLGGQIGVESQVGHGSLFYFTLPAAASQPQS